MKAVSILILLTVAAAGTPSVAAPTSFSQQFILCGVQKVDSANGFKKFGPLLTIAFKFNLRPNSDGTAMEADPTTFEFYDPNKLFISEKPEPLHRALNESSFISTSPIDATSFVSFVAVPKERVDKNSPDSFRLTGAIMAGDASGQKRNADHLYEGGCLYGRPDKSFDLKGLKPVMEAPK